MIPLRHSHLTRKNRAKYLAQVRRARRRRARRNNPYVTEHSILDRIFYAVINGVTCVLVGILIDLLITLIRSVGGAGDGSVFWLFTPILLVIGATIGALSGSHAGADSMNMIGATENPRLEEISISHDVFHGIGVGIFMFTLIWLVMLMLT